VFRDVTLRDVRVLGGGRVTLDGHDAERPLGITLDGVTADDPARISVSAQHAEVTVGPRGTNLAIAGDDVHVRGAATHAADGAAPNDCAAKLVPFPVP
jgi:polygalacturonase